MQVDRVLFPIESLGPGKRLVIWTIGCSKHCVNCSNQELWKPDLKRDIPIEHFADIVLGLFEKNDIEGVTITGGDPLEQREELLYLLKVIHPKCKDILVYTGFTWEEIRSSFDLSEIEQLKENVGVLIDGPYMDEKNETNLGLRGSSNQTIHYFDTTLKERYEKHIEQGRKIQNVYYGKQMVSVGIHNKERNDDYC